MAFKTLISVSRGPLLGPKVKLPLLIYNQIILILRVLVIFNSDGVRSISRPFVSTASILLLLGWKLMFESNYHKRSGKRTVFCWLDHEECIRYSEYPYPINLIRLPGFCMSRNRLNLSSDTCEAVLDHGSFLEIVNHSMMNKEVDCLLGSICFEKGPFLKSRKHVKKLYPWSKIIASSLKTILKRTQLDLLNTIIPAHIPTAPQLICGWCVMS